MANENLRTCITCGKKYKFCRMCGDGKFPWKVDSCSPRCYDVSRIVNEYFYDQISAQEAMKELNLAGYQEIETMNASTGAVIAKIKKSAAAEKKKAEKETLSVGEAASDENPHSI